VAQVVGLQNVFDGEVLGHLPDEHATLLRRGSLTLRWRYQPEFSQGARVSSTIPPGAIALHPDPEAVPVNVIAGRIADLVALPGIVRVVFLAGDDPTAALVFPVAGQFTERARLQVGQPGSVALMADAIHLMRA
jgi:hypothetical protein